MATEQQKRPEDDMDDLASLYGDVRGLEPSAQLDAGILAAARAESASAPAEEQPAAPRRPVAEAWRTPFAAVASVMLCTVVYFSLPDPDTADYLPIPGVAEPEFEVRAAPTQPRAVGSVPAAPPAPVMVAPQRHPAESLADEPVDQVSNSPLVSYSGERAAAPAPSQSAAEAGRYESLAEYQARGQAGSPTPAGAEPVVEWSSDAGVAGKSAPAATIGLVSSADHAPEVSDTRTLPQAFLDALRDGLVRRIGVAGDAVAGTGAPAIDSEAGAAPAFLLQTSCAMPADQDAAHVLLLLRAEQEPAPGGAAGESAAMADAGATAGRPEGLCVQVMTGQDGLPDAFARAWASMRADGTVRQLLDHYGLQQWSPR